MHPVAGYSVQPKYLRLGVESGGDDVEGPDGAHNQAGHAQHGQGTILKGVIQRKIHEFYGKTKPIVKDVRDSGDECRCNFEIQALKNIALINEISSDIMIERGRKRQTDIYSDRQTEE